MTPPNLAANDEVCSNTLDVMKALEVVVPSVKDVEGVLLVGYLVHRFGVMHSGRCDVEEWWKNVGI